jgi:hypothetical protein
MCYNIFTKNTFLNKIIVYYLCYNTSVNKICFSSIWDLIISLLAIRFLSVFY